MFGRRVVGISEENKNLDWVLSFAMCYMCYFGADGIFLLWEVYLVQRSYI